MIDKSIVGKGLDRTVYLYDEERHIELYTTGGFDSFIINNYYQADDLLINDEQLLVLADMIAEMKKEMGIR